VFPLVTVVMTAFDSERFVGAALDSALGQDYPADRLEVVVVDDGSSDATAAVAEAYVAGGRVRLVRQANSGNVAATNAALPYVRGDVVALLDSDDEWPADHVRTAVALLAARPAVGLVYGDMTLIDAEGAMLADSWLEVIGVRDPAEGRCFGRLLAATPATSSSIVLRGDVWRAITPIPPAMPMPDWYLALRAAQLAELAFRARPRTLYRFHGRNRGLGAEGEVLRRSHLRRARLQRWFLRRLAPGETTDAELAAAWSAFERNVTEAIRLAGSPFEETVAVSADDRAEALRLTGAAPADPAAFVRAAAADPWCDAARAGVPAVG
jgi:hypothetical protein